MPDIQIGQIWVREVYGKEPRYFMYLGEGDDADYPHKIYVINHDYYDEAAPKFFLDSRMIADAP